MAATSVSNWAIVTALPPARAGSATGLRNSHVATNPSTARMSRNNTPANSYHASSPRRATVMNATAMKALSAIGSSTLPAREAPKRRARNPSATSLAAAAATRASCHAGERKFGVGQYVCKEGEPGNRLLLSGEGEVGISGTIAGSGEEALAVLKPG